VLQQLGPGIFFEGKTPILYLDTPVKAPGGGEYIGLVVLLFIDK